MRKSCLECVTKHLMQAMVLLMEAEKSIAYAKHAFYAIGHLAEAEDECLDYPELCAKIREERVAYMKDRKYIIDFDGLLDAVIGTRPIDTDWKTMVEDNLKRKKGVTEIDVSEIIKEIDAIANKTVEPLIDNYFKTPLWKPNFQAKKVESLESILVDKTDEQLLDNVKNKSAPIPMREPDMTASEMKAAEWERWKEKTRRFVELYGSDAKTLKDAVDSGLVTEEVIKWMEDNPKIGVFMMKNAKHIVEIEKLNRSLERVNKAKETGNER